jgi:hypothetical protein
LEITNIKPAGTGDPVIPSTNRIFRAYPGIEYNIRAAVIGGTYPYTYSLNNAPEGMTINSRTGEIVWPNPQLDASDIQLSVKDSENTTVSTAWSITVSANGFLFVDVWKGRHEVDFLLREGNKIIKAVNVCWELNQDSREREVAGIAEAMEEFGLKKGEIITMGYAEEIKVKGKKILVKNILEEWARENK